MGQISVQARNDREATAAALFRSRNAKYVGKGSAKNSEAAA